MKWCKYLNVFFAVLCVKETKTKLEKMEKNMKDLKKDMQSVWEQLRAMYIVHQVTNYAVT